MFELIDKINNSKEKKFFLEKINIYIKLVELISKFLNLKLFRNNYEFNQKTFLKICELNIYKSNIKYDDKLLIKILKKNLYQQFIAAVNFNVKYKRRIGNLLDKFDHTKRNIININSKRKNKFTLVDFFCGAGGFSYGFVQENFKIELANDNDWECIETYKLNHPEILDKKIIRDDIKKVINSLDKFLPSPIDVVIGGPPCQGFSNANRQRIINDPRNKLYKYFIIAVKKINPKIVVMENVMGMYSYAEQVKKDFDNISYKLDYDILVSDQFGVAQKRQRLFFIAFRKDIWEEKKINIKDIFNEIKLSAENVNRHILKDALDYIKPLKSPKTKNQTEIDDVLTGKKIDINSFKGNENSYLRLINQNRKILFTFNHKARFANKINYQIFSKLKQGEDGTSKKIQDIFPYKHRNHIFKDKYFKLDQYKPSKTITAHLRMDCLSHIHPTQIRTITPREAARIQSFPDDYFFLGPYLKTYMQIGNAVPPIMSKYIAKVIKKYL